jgi:cell division protease FtsH
MEQATNLARLMVTRWGMSEALGPVSLAPRNGSFLPGQGALGVGTGKVLSEATSQLVDGEVRRVLDECYDRAVQLLHQHREQLEALARALLEHDTLDEGEVLRVTGLPRAPRLETLPVPAGVGEGATGAPLAAALTTPGGGGSPPVPGSGTG